MPRRVRAGLRQRGDVLAVEQHVAGRGSQRAGDQIDQRGFAGAVRPDQRVAGAARQREIDVVGDTGARRSSFAGCGFRSAASVIGLARLPGATIGRRPQAWPNRPRRANSTTTISSSPMPNCQNSGLSFRELVLQHHVEHSADEGAVQPPAPPRISITSTAADWSKSNTPSVTRIGLREQRAGDAGDRRRRLCRRRPAANAPASRSRACARRFRGCRRAPGRTANRRCGARQESNDSTPRQ